MRKCVNGHDRCAGGPTLGCPYCENVTVVAKKRRNDGASLGLQYPYVSGRYARNLRIWHRHTGEVVFTGTEKNMILRENEVSKKLYELNGLSQYPDAEVIRAMDETP